MKKRALKIGLIMACFAMICTSLIGFTLAQYISSGSGNDSATVAKWGVTVTTTSTAFEKTYATASAVDGITNAVSGETDRIAPGTSGTLVAVTIAGTPEVAVNVKKEATLTLTNWTIASADYCPLIFTVGATKYYIGNGTITTVAQLIAAVETAIEDNENCNPGTDLATTHDVTVAWAWLFTPDTTTYAGLTQTAANDTAIGNAGTATIGITVETTVTQID